MNLLLLAEDQLLNDKQAIVKDRQLTHIQQVHKSKEGDTINVGIINGLMGQGVIHKLTQEYAIIDFELNKAPPPKLPITLILALPRPKMLRRILQTITSMGVEKLILINSYKVEKSFWQTPFLTPAAIDQQIILGLEQAKDTVFPEIQLIKYFKPFVEDKLPALIKNTQNLIAHLGDHCPCPSNVTHPITLAIGPEGGWIDYEVNKLKEIGFSTIQIGERILRVETAVTALISKLYY